MGLGFFFYFIVSNKPKAELSGVKILSEKISTAINTEGIATRGYETSFRDS